jgi:hypothetical protein
MAYANDILFQIQNSATYNNVLNFFFLNLERHKTFAQYVLRTEKGIIIYCKKKKNNDMLILHKTVRIFIQKTR